MRPRPQGRQFRGISRIGPSLRLTFHANAAVGFPNPLPSRAIVLGFRVTRGDRVLETIAAAIAPPRGGKKPAATDCHAS
jgi:hypothetical protein